MPLMRRQAPLAFFAALVCILCFRSAAAEQFTPAQRAEIVDVIRDALKQDPSILRDAVAALQADESKRQAQNVVSHLDQMVGPADPVAGNPAGNVTIVEFFDVRCPYCRKLEPAMAQLLAGDHQVRLVYKDLPILGPASILGSRALLAAQKQGGYEKLRDRLMQAPPDITEDTVRQAAQQTGLDWPRLKQDMDDAGIQQRLNANLALAREIGIEGTPALVVGGQFLPGAVDLPELQKAIATERAKG
ncbi:MAG TPA: DsbA family protein [Acetobacteraceae bacterium]|nr:DsbA family protein [Acetobacteraceae bacterium]